MVYASRAWEESMLAVKTAVWEHQANSAPLCRPDCILVLDTWFMLVVHYGKTIVEWRKAGYHLQPDQDGFR